MLHRNFVRIFHAGFLSFFRISLHTLTQRTKFLSRVFQGGPRRPSQLFQSRAYELKAGIFFVQNCFHTFPETVKQSPSETVNYLLFVSITHYVYNVILTYVK